ncbi:MAG: PHP domain-containing protein [Bacteroidales bacterium]|nr:PHP domain-containing protein [Bacteroidales bacterium]
MKTFSADLHIHTVLSPCGDLEMSPVNIVNKAKERGLNIIGITDHNSTRHCRLIQKLAAEKEIFVLCGAEVTSIEEVHCLCFMPDFNRLDSLQYYLDHHLLDIKNDVNKFGHQVQVDENEMIIYQEEKLLIQSINQSINQIEAFVHRHDGLFIPAHINRPAFSIVSQLGFIPEDLNFDALEISRHTTRDTIRREYPYLWNTTILKDSDAHFIEDIGLARNYFQIEKPDFEEIKMALKKMEGRFVQ